MFCPYLSTSFASVSLPIKLVHFSVVCISLSHLSARAQKHIMKETVNLVLIVSLTLLAAIVNIDPANGQGMMPVSFFLFFSFFVLNLKSFTDWNGNISFLVLHASDLFFFLLCWFVCLSFCSYTIQNVHVFTGMARNCLAFLFLFSFVVYLFCSWCLDLLQLFHQKP